MLLATGSVCYCEILVFDVIYREPTRRKSDQRLRSHAVRRRRTDEFAMDRTIFVISRRVSWSHGRAQISVLFIFCVFNIFTMLFVMWFGFPTAASGRASCMRTKQHRDGRRARRAWATSRGSYPPEILFFYTFFFPRRETRQPTQDSARAVRRSHRDATGTEDRSRAPDTPVRTADNAYYRYKICGRNDGRRRRRSLSNVVYGCIFTYRYTVQVS